VSSSDELETYAASELHIHASSTFDNCVALTFDLLTSGSILSRSYCHRVYMYHVWRW